MFYLAAKVFWVVAQPVSLVALLLVASVILLSWGRRRLGLSTTAVALLLLLLCGFTSLGAMIIRPLEDRFTRPSVMPETVDSIIVLGGSTLARVSTGRGVAELNEAGDRLTDAVALARLYPEAKIVFSGGEGIIDRGEPEAATAERFLLSQGIAPQRLVLEDQARNTDENAELTAEMLGEAGGRSILVTSAFHMPRSMGLFRRVGLDVVPWPTDYRSSGQESFGFDFANPIHNLNVSSVAIKEWIGLLVYSWTGRIDTVLPAQTSN